jgi:hypothetical protein
LRMLDVVPFDEEDESPFAGLLHVESGLVSAPTVLGAGASLGRGCSAVNGAIAELEAEGFLWVDRRRGRYGWKYRAESHAWP